MSFELIPDEIILNIAQKSTGNLRNLSQCCKRLQRIVEPILCSKFTQRYSVGSPNDKTLIISSFLLETMCKPHLSQYVKVFKCSVLLTWEENDEDMHIDLSNLSSEQLLWIREHHLQGEVHGEEHCEKWYRALFSVENWDAVMALLFSILSSSMEQLLIDDIGRADLPYIDAMMMHANKLQTEGLTSGCSLSHLRSVDLMYYGTEYGMGVERVLPYLSLPSLQILKANHIMEEDFMNEGENYAFLADEVEFHYSAMDSDSMTNFLKCFTRLRKFVFSYGICTNNGAMDEMEPGAIGRGLQHLKHCLEELDVSGVSEVDDDQEVLPNAEEFTLLKGWI